MNRRFDVAVVGGGLVGASAAYFLASRHRLDVVLLERGRVGAQASGVNFGNVRRQGRTINQLPLAHHARAIWGELDKHLDDPCEFLVTGHLKLAFDDEQMAALEDYAPRAGAAGLDLELMGANAVHTRFPFLGKGVVGGSFSPQDGNANPRLVAPAFGRAARRAGADVRENTEVLDITRTADGFALETRDGSLRAGTVVNAAGAWAGRLAQSFGDTVPMTPRGPMMAVTEPLRYAIRPVLGTGDSSFYMRQVERGSVVFGGGARVDVDLDNPFPRPRPEHLLVQLGHMRRLVPSLAGVQVIRTWSGVEGYMDDKQPAIGFSPNVPGLIHAFGFTGHGFQLAPGVGSVVAELAASGTSPVPLESYAVDRFAASGDAR
ncbi:hypothetical protein DLJ53_12020 [Acuticoccus sediminis]|uniref:FAD dependent oxidoreductase domain-containing protein n=1 Tax=Acuticoccus sediminis TaxID=2184697 RepID=A0A8B2NWB7_9HYPH|nr:FAD-dependent oxidoreductase [Acuticoccus sediminis]RAI02093.1 hypothetical protein DLJ53_12020 [Acuticoccus sediminis]